MTTRTWGNKEHMRSMPPFHVKAKIVPNNLRHFPHPCGS